MEQPADSPESSRPDGAESASRAEGGVSASEHKEEERLESWIALIDAASRGELARVKDLIEGMKTNGVDINCQYCYGYTALMLACVDGYADVALELLKVDGLDVNVQNRHGYIALIKACSYGHADVALGLLRDPRVDRHIKNSDGSDALVLARNMGLTAVVTRLEALRRGDERIFFSYR